MEEYKLLLKLVEQNLSRLSKSMDSLSKMYQENIELYRDLVEYEREKRRNWITPENILKGRKI